MKPPLEVPVFLQQPAPELEKPDESAIPAAIVSTLKTDESVAAELAVIAQHLAHQRRLRHTLEVESFEEELRHMNAMQDLAVRAQQIEDNIERLKHLRSDLRNHQQRLKRTLEKLKEK
jgi:hypothetical protein